MNYIRDHMQLPISNDYFQARRAEGWTLRAIEWEREEGAHAGAGKNAGEDVPFGLEIVSGSLQLAENPGEMNVLLTILEMIVKDQSVPVIAAELNRRGYANRGGGQWTAPAVFELLPRVIEMGPTLLKSSKWLALRPTATAH
jgi:hypothetical protein